jgi:hypothetical protein
MIINKKLNQAQRHILILKRESGDESVSGFFRETDKI